ncbi:hypothetical protein GCM10027176_59320 [Actinoallomurus bryophytorum]
MFCAELRVSTRPAFLTAVTSVDRAGLLEAAVATGSADMPEKLPLPLLGTAEQPAPKGLSDIAALDVAPAAGADAVDEEDEALSSLLLPPQAAPLSSRPPATILTARTRVFT